MGTRSLTRVFDVHPERGGNCLVCIYGQYDGYIKDGLGDQLKEIVTDAKIVEGISLGENADCYNGVECFAASLVGKLKDGIGGFYLYPIMSPSDSPSEEYNYDIWPSENGDKLVLRVKTDDSIERMLVSDVPKSYVEFVYPTSTHPIENVWRMVELVERNDEYICGLDVDDNLKFKRYRIDRIVGGKSKIIETTK